MIHALGIEPLDQRLIAVQAHGCPPSIASLAAEDRQAAYDTYGAAYKRLMGSARAHRPGTSAPHDHPGAWLWSLAGPGHEAWFGLHLRRGGGGLHPAQQADAEQ
jgi:hypothetical protein